MQSELQARISSSMASQIATMNGQAQALPVPRVNADYLRAAGVAMPREIIGYEIKDRQTGRIVGKYGPGERVRASRRVDRLDNEYGAYRYHVVTLYKEII